MDDVVVVECEPAMRTALVSFLNGAYCDLQALPPVGVERPDYPEFTEASVGAWTEDAQRGATLLAMDGAGIVSAAGYTTRPDERVAELRFIGTAPSRRRQGHASRLLRQLADRARDQGLASLRTGSFVDSRYVPACQLLEASGFVWQQPEHSNVTMEIDIDGWQPREPELPSGYRLRPFEDGDEQRWVDLKNAIFDGETTVEWFRRRFRDRPNFDPDGWFFLEREGRPVGIAGAIVWYHDAVMARPSGALLEWVGVLPEDRGKGLGEALVVTCLNYLKRRNVFPNCLVTQPFRHAAVSLYRKLGYRLVREWRTYAKAL